MAYTSASTALNQKLSVKAKAKAPTAALPKIAKALVFSISCFLEIRLVINIVSDQNINNMVNALENTDIRLMVSAIYVASGANIEKNAPSNWYNGAPGG